MRLPITMCLALYLLLAAQPALAFDMDYYTILNAQTDETPLYSMPAGDSDIIGLYANGSSGYVREQPGEWTYIDFGQWDEIGPGGYIRTEHTQVFDEHLEAFLIPVGIVQSADGQGTAMYQRANENDTPLGQFPDGAKLLMLGEITGGEWIHVQHGSSVYGYVHAANIQPTGERARVRHGIAAIGYGVVHIENMDYDMLSLYSLCLFPTLESTTDDHPFPGYTLEILADLGEWQQVRTHNGAEGFLETRYLSRYYLSDLQPTLGGPLGAGVYHVGGDLPPGLYTLEVPEGSAGSLEAYGGASGLGRLHEATDGGHFTTYLEEGMELTLRGEATLQPMCPLDEPVSRVQWMLAGDGRYLCGAELPVSPFGLYTIRLMPGETTGAYGTSTLDNELRPDTDMTPSLHHIREGETAYVSLEAGTFLTFRNCIIEAGPGNG